MTRVAVVLLNLGGPDSLAAVRPFLVNLFSDPAILTVPSPLRRVLAWWIARKRAPVARRMYERIGGSSPLLKETEAQAWALEERLGETPGLQAKVFIAMRYWHPLTAETVAHVARWKPDRLVILPLYPQFSFATTGSSLREWQEQAAVQGLSQPTSVVERYETAPDLIAAQADLLRASLAKVDPKAAQVLFSAHGLPMRLVEKGDPYPRQIEATARAIADAAGLRDDQWRLTYQSRVGPLQWLEPYTDEAIKAAGAAGLSLVVLPISFVSEHSETLVELDLDYRELAVQSGVPVYERVPAVGCHPLFIEALRGLVVSAVSVKTETGDA
jgi:ferrochelatase